MSCEIYATANHSPFFVHDVNGLWQPPRVKIVCRTIFGHDFVLPPAAQHARKGAIIASVIKRGKHLVSVPAHLALNYGSTYAMWNRAIDQTKW